MTKYSLEPSRRHLIVHHTFDHRDGDSVVDSSPQATDGAVVGNVTFGHRGIIGSAARMKDESNHVKVEGLNSFLPLDELLVSTWGRSEHPTEPSTTNASVTITISGTDYTLTYNASDEITEWEHAVLTYDGETARLYYGRASDESLSLVDSVDVVGSVDGFDVTVFTKGYGYADDVRVYRRNIGRASAEDLHTMGAENTFSDEVGDAWSNDGMPFRGSNEQLGGALAEPFSQTTRELDAIRDARHIDSAGGRQLDDIGQSAGVRRKESESDAKYRARIKATLTAAGSSGTFRGILNSTARILETDKRRVEVRTEFSSDPATAFVYVQASDVESSELTAAELTDVLKDTVLAGHDIEVTKQGENPFEIIDDTMTNDPDRGLTSDSISTGGGLVSDV